MDWRCVSSNRTHEALSSKSSPTKTSKQINKKTTILLILFIDKIPSYIALFYVSAILNLDSGVAFKCHASLAFFNLEHFLRLSLVLITLPPLNNRVISIF
jgi:hypothetical protein